ncbi:hypothetical protein HYU19_05815 [Candidatus Woesearchaeota archaeon]|nr:hypothetical protein [Candidatus Woesearchaeota archaeon]
MSIDETVTLVDLRANGTAHLTVGGKAQMKPYGHPLQNPLTGGIFLEGTANPFAEPGKSFSTLEGAETYITALHSLNKLLGYANDYSAIPAASESGQRRAHQMIALAGLLRDDKYLAVLRGNPAARPYISLLTVEPVTFSERAREIEIRKTG